MKCDGCQNDNVATTGAVINGRFGQYCTVCRHNNTRQDSPRSAQYNRDRDREAHEKDLIQPWANGKPNREFIRNYPESAKDYFTDEELAEHG